MTGTELSVDDVIAYTGGRLEDDDETARLLAAALAAVRDWCRWHVNPIRVDDEVTVNGPGGWVLVLPTLNLVDISKLVENGVEQDLAGLTWTADGRVEKNSGARWTRNYSGITVTMTHGFDDTAAAAWRQAVLGAVDLMAQVKSRIDPALIQKDVDDVSYRWSPAATNETVFDKSLVGRFQRDYV